MKSILIAGSVFAALATAPAAFAVAVSIPATSNIYLAGGNTYTSNSCVLLPQTDCIGFAPVEVDVTGATSLSFTGFNSTVFASSENSYNADGIIQTGAYFGGSSSNAVSAAGVLSGFTFNAGQFALVGVFLGPSLPGSAPGQFDGNEFPLGDDYENILLGQVFFIGDGQGTNGTQTFYVPVGATRLFLGFVDQYFDSVACPSSNCTAGLYGDNSGHLDGNVNIHGASVIPEPSAMLLFATGLAGIAFRRFRRA